MTAPRPPSSPGPDGLRIRQTRDATVIRVFPHAPPRPWREALASVGAVLVWAGLRSAWAHGGAPGGLGAAVAMHALLLGVLAALGWHALQGVRLGQEVLEVYVGKRFLELVYSRGGGTVRQQSLELVRLEDAQPQARSVRLLVEEGEPMEVPMALHSDEARGWMVEHLRGAGLGARRRYGHLPLAGSALADGMAGKSSAEEGEGGPAAT